MMLRKDDTKFTKTYILRSCERQLYSDLLEENKNNIKGTWRVINYLLNKKSANKSYPSECIKDGVTITGNKTIAECFNTFFVNVGPTLARDIPTCDEQFASFLGDRIDNSIFLSPVTDEEILDIVHNAKGKRSSGCDGIDMCLVKQIVPFVLAPLKHVSYTSLEMGVFPDAMKIARVVLLFKAGDQQNLSNYRPISLLPQFSKILEKLYNNRLMDFFDFDRKQALYSPPPIKTLSSLVVSFPSSPISFRIWNLFDVLT